MKQAWRRWFSHAGHGVSNYIQRHWWIRIFFSMPRSFFGRNLLLIVVLIATVELGVSILFRELVQEPRLTSVIDVAELHIEALREALVLMTPAQRKIYLAQLDQQNAELIKIHSITDQNTKPAQFVEPDYRIIKTFIQTLSQHLGHDYQIGWQNDPEPRLWIGSRVDTSTYWLGINAGVFIRSVAPLFIAFASGGGILALLGAYLIQRRINRPLYALDHAVMDIGRGKIEPLQLHNAPTEIAQVVASFNQMANALETTERERALMLAGISHDLRTPLTKLRLGIEILSDSGGDPRIIESMVRNVAAADAVIGQFIDFARLGSDEPLRSCDLNELVSQVAHSFERLPIRLELGELPPYICRPLALRRAIMNLIENALRYSTPKTFDAPDDVKTKGAGFITVQTDVIEHALRIRVLDCGPGIPESEMLRLRQPFTRLDEARSNQCGAGLGLAIVERIAHLHHGELRLANRADGGLEAGILLPMPT